MPKKFFAVLMAFTLLAGLVVALASPPAFADDDDEAAQEERGKPVRVNGKDMALWVFVHPDKGEKDDKGRKHEESAKPLPRVVASHCIDGDQVTIIARFAKANASGLTFNINNGSIPINKTAAIGAVQASFATWDAVSTAATYFTVNNTGGASRPAFDGNNTVGWVRIVPKNVLAAAWVWVDSVTKAVVQADIFFNAYHKWGTFTTCNAQSTYEVGNVGTHEVGHVVGLNHLSDPNAYATMYPSAAKGEVRKRTLTTGDQSGYTAAGGY